MNVDGLQPDQTAQLAETFGLLADPTRLSIVLVCMKKETAAGDIADELGLSASLVSHHLRLLRAARMLWWRLMQQCVPICRTRNPQER